MRTPAEQVPAGSSLVTSQCLHQLLQHWAAATPAAPCLRYEGASLTYAQVDGRADTIARTLVREGLVRLGDRVGLLMERSLELVVSILAIFKAGGVYVPLETMLPPSRLTFLVQDADCRVLLTQRHLQTLAADIAPTTKTLVMPAGAACENDDSSADRARLLPAGDPDHVAYLMYTSGSTGKPKGALLAHRGLVSMLLALAELYRLGPRDVFLHKTPISFDVSLDEEVMLALTVGAPLVIAPPRLHCDAGGLVQLIAQEGVTVASFVPTMLAVVLQEEGFARCTALKNVLVAGEVLPPHSVLQFRRVLPAASLHNVYGPSETREVTSFNTVAFSPSDSSVPIGRALPGIGLHVLDSSLQPVPAGTVGELCITGCQVAVGYHNRPELTAARFVFDPFTSAPAAGTGEGKMFRTGDLVRVRADGELEFCGRQDDQVKWNGVRLELGELETYLAQAPGVKGAVAKLWTESGSESQLVAYVTPADADAANVWEHLRDSCPSAVLPVALVRLQELPLLSSGKVDRKSLPRPDYNASVTGMYSPPVTPLEDIVHSIWQEVLPGSRISAEADFLSLGGTSLLANRIISRLRQSLHMPGLPLDLVFTAPTIRQQARAIDKAMGPSWSSSSETSSASSSAFKSKQQDEVILPCYSRKQLAAGVPMSFVQEGMLFFANGLDYRSPDINDTLALQLCGDLDVRALLYTFQVLFARHELLRARFATDLRYGAKVKIASPEDAPFSFTYLDAATGGVLPLPEQLAWDQAQKWAGMKAKDPKASAVKRGKPPPLPTLPKLAVKVCMPLIRMTLSRVLTFGLDSRVRTWQLPHACGLAACLKRFDHCEPDDEDESTEEVCFEEQADKCSWEVSEAGYIDSLKAKLGLGSWKDWEGLAMLHESRSRDNLQKGLVMRVLLRRHAEGRHMLLVDLHHIVEDAWSISIITNELEQLYSGFVRGAPVMLPELRLSFFDVVAWQRTEAIAQARQLLNAGQSPWLAMLEGVRPLWNLRTDKVRPAVQCLHAGRAVHTALGVKLVTQLRQLGMAHRATFGMVLLAGWACLLRRHCADSDDLVINSFHANRAQAGTEGLVGPLFLPLPVRIRLAKGLTFKDALAVVRMAALETAGNVDEFMIPALGECMLRAQGAAAVCQAWISHNPISQATFDVGVDEQLAVCEPRPLRLEGLGATACMPPAIGSRYDLTLKLESAAGGMAGRIEYNSELFEESTIQRLERHLQAILQKVVQQPGVPITQLPPVSDREEQDHAWLHAATVEVPGLGKVTGARVLDTNGQPCPWDIAGELCLSNNSSSKRRATPAGTGLRALLRPGSKLEILGRIENEITLHNMPLRLEDVERSICQLCPQVTAAAATIRPSQRHQDGQMLVAFVAPASVNVAAIKRGMLRSVAQHFVPAVVVAVPALPTWLNGQVDRSSLAAVSDAKAVQLYVAPRTHLEGFIQALWEALLPRRLRPISVHADFAEMGGGLALV